MDSELSRKPQFISPYEFIYFPASVVLLTGDTLQGTFTRALGPVYWIHSNNDSNVFEEKSAYPVSQYYKKIEVEQIRSYFVKGHRYESAVMIQNARDTQPAWDRLKICFVEKLNAKPSSIDFYLLFADYTRNEKNSLIVDMLFPADTSFGPRQFDLQYCLHLPGDAASVLWNLSDYRMADEIKSRLSRVWQACPELASLGEKVRASSKQDTPISAILRYTGNKDKRIEPVLLDIIARYNACQLQQK
jgi:hypothetical protein